MVRISFQKWSEFTWIEFTWSEFTWCQLSGIHLGQLCAYTYVYDVHCTYLLMVKCRYAFILTSLDPSSKTGVIQC